MISDYKEVTEWMKGPNTGLSSKFMAAVLCGEPTPKNINYPLDPSDFERCLELLKAAPYLKKDLHLLRKTHPVWKAYVENWNEMERLYNIERPSGVAPRLYGFMNNLIGEVEASKKINLYPKIRSVLDKSVKGIDGVPLSDIARRITNIVDELILDLKNENEELKIKLTRLTEESLQQKSEVTEEMPQFDSLDIYLQKDGRIIGLHAIGESDAKYKVVDLDGSETMKKGFLAFEQWGNEYDQDYKMIGRGSFRVFGDIEEEAKEFEADGWVRFERKDK